MKNKNNKYVTIATSIILVVTMIACCFTGCNKDPNPVTEPGSTDDQTSVVSSGDITTEDDTTKEKTTKPSTKPDAETTKQKEKETTTKENTTKPKETTTQKPETTTEKPETTTEKPVRYTDVNETVYAVDTVNVRTGPGTGYSKVGQLSKGSSVKRTAKGDNGWSKVNFNGTTCYIASNYLTTTKPVTETTTQKPTETTTQKPTETTTENVTEERIKSAAAKEIVKWYGLELFNPYEGKSADGKTMVVYFVVSGEKCGIDHNKAFYDANGNKTICDVCGKNIGDGTNMCNGSCSRIFH